MQHNVGGCTHSSCVFYAFLKRKLTISSKQEEIRQKKDYYHDNGEVIFQANAG